VMEKERVFGVNAVVQIEAVVAVFGGGQNELGFS
jgi:hypothetical protein